MRKRDRNVIHPEATFERVSLQRLERGTLRFLAAMAAGAARSGKGDVTRL
jgi:hypothetical protein